MFWRKGTLAFFWVTILAIIGCVILVVICCGFYHEARNFHNIVGTLVFVLLIHYIIMDPIKFSLLSIDKYFWPSRTNKYSERKSEKHTRFDLLKLKLKSLKSKLLINFRHRNEPVNENYRHNCHELWIYGKYFLILFLWVLISRNRLMFINTNWMKEMFMFNHSDQYGLTEVKYNKHFYHFVHSAFINAFSIESGVGWIHAEQTKLLGVVRLRQLRLDNTNFGLSTPTFASDNYMPGWATPFKDYHFKNMFWRIYDPWLKEDIKPNGIGKILLYMDDVGMITNYPRLSGYMTLLARSKQNNQQITDFLFNNSWLNRNTSVIYMDFTLYNVDVNLFTICTLRLERTPFGDFIPDIYIDSYKLLQNIDQLSFMELFIILLYILVVIQFCKRLIVKLWFEPDSLANVWTVLDLGLLMLNVIILAMSFIREWMVNNMISRIEVSHKLEYIDFRNAAAFSDLIAITIAILVGLTTIRLWKVLQFTHTFQLFTRTLYLASQGSISTVASIIILVIAFSITVNTINGNNNDRFNYLIKSITTCLCFVFGFSHEINPESLYHGGKLLGIFIYVIMAFVVAVLLINIFVSLISEYFRTARNFYKKGSEISFLEFIRVEYADCWIWCYKICCCKKIYRRHGRTVSQNIDRREKVNLRKMELTHRRKPDTETDERYAEQIYRVSRERILSLFDILKLQIEMLHEILISSGENKHIQRFTWDTVTEKHQLKRKPN